MNTHSALTPTPVSTSTTVPTSVSSPALFSPTTLLEALARPVQEHPERRAISFLLGEQPPSHFTYAQMWAEGEAAAARLLAAGIGASDRVLLVGHQDAHLVQIWFGVVMVGAVPAICPFLPSVEPGEEAKQAVSVARTVRFAKKSGARALLAPSVWLPVIAEALAAEGIEPSACVLVAMDIAAPTNDAAPTLPSISPDPESPAYIQLTSGTTGDANGTLISHSALLAHIRQLQRWLGVGAEDVIVGWLPLSHDLGLVTHFLLPWLCDYPVLLLTPEQWVRRPRTLLRAAHSYGATHLAMPTFGYAHCTQHIRDEELEGVDLSGLRYCIVGAEVIPAATMHAFVERFAPWGVRPEMICPGYGMAEVVVAASITPVGRGMYVDYIAREPFQREGKALPVAHESERGSSVKSASQGSNALLEEEPEGDYLAWVGCGQALPDTHIEIVNGANKPLPERHVGQIVIRRTGLGTAPVSGHGTPTLGTVYTRDIGYLADGELYVCGRQDDLMILGGANVYPEAIEITALAVIGENAGRAAAFGVRDKRLSTETAVLVCEVRGRIDAERERELGAAIRRAVRVQHEIVLGDLYFVRRGWIETGDSGKVARKATQAKYQALGRMAQLTMLPEVGNLAEAGPDQVVVVAQALADRLALMLGLTGAERGVGVHSDLFDLGLTSLTATALLTTLRRERRNNIAVEQWIAQPTCAHLAELLLNTTYPSALEPQSAPSLPTEDAPAPAVVDETTIDETTTADLAQPETAVQPQMTETVDAERVAAVTPPPDLQLQKLYVPQRSDKRHGMLWQKFVGVGPRSDRLGGVALPYALGTRLQQQWLSQAWVQERFFAPEVQLLSAWLNHVGRPIEATTVLKSLMFNSWPHWRRRAFADPAVAARWLQVRGELPVETHKEGRAIVFAITHTPGRWIVADWITRQAQLNAPNRPKHAAQSALITSYGITEHYHLDEILRQGGNAVVAMDGWSMERGTPTDLGQGVRRDLYRGVAEVALQYDAAIVPVQVRFDIDGVMQMEFMPALKDSSPSPDAVANLMAEYAREYSAQWPHTLEYLSWNFLNQTGKMIQE